MPASCPRAKSCPIWRFYEEFDPACRPALACALGLSACGGGSGDLPLAGTITGGVTKDGLVLQNNGGDDLAVPAGATSFQFAEPLSTDDEFNITVKSMPSNVEHLHRHQRQRARQLLHGPAVPRVLHDQAACPVGRRSTA